MALSADHGFLGRGASNLTFLPPAILVHDSPHVELEKILFPRYPQEKRTAWILARPAVYPADLLSRRSRGEGIVRLSLGRRLVNLLPAANGLLIYPSIP